MNVSEAVASRRAVRAFSQRPVPLHTIRALLDKARMAPSGCNYQPWEAVVVAGDPLRRVQRAMSTTARQDPPEYIIHPPTLPPMYRERLEEAMRPVYHSVGIERADAEARKAFTARNCDGFGAPVLLLCFIPACMGLAQWADAGMWLQTVMLLLREEGLDSCPQGFVSYFADAIKAELGVSDPSLKLFCGLAIGHREDGAEVNSAERSRIPLDRQVKFIGF